MKILHLAFAGAIALASFTGTAFAQSADNFLTITLKDGPVVVELRPDIAPKHVEQIKALAAAGEYDNVAFHRVIKGFMAQTGDVQYGDMENGYQPQAAGTGGSSRPDIPAEFSDVPFERGTVGMARSQDPNSANSQFFIMFGEAPSLNGQYTVIGEVVSGMDVVDKLKKAPPGSPGGAVTNPDKMVKVQVASDVK